MVKYKDIIEAINKKLSDNFKDIKIMSDKDVTENIKRPGFITSIDGIKSNNFMSHVIDKSLTVRIYYFPTNMYKNKIENLNMVDALTELFIENDLLELDNFNITIGENTNTDIFNGLVNFNFDIEFSETLNKTSVGDNDENMEILNTNL